MSLLSIMLRKNLPQSDKRGGIKPETKAVAKVDVLSNKKAPKPPNKQPNQDIFGPLPRWDRADRQTRLAIIGHKLSKGLIPTSLATYIGYHALPDHKQIVASNLALGTAMLVHLARGFHDNAWSKDKTK